MTGLHAIFILDEASAVVSQPSPPINLPDLCIGLAIMSVTVGSIVGILLLHSFEQLRTLRPLLQETLNYAAIREESRLKMLRSVTSLSMVSLMLSSLLLIFGITTELMALSTLAAIGLALFTYGVVALLAAFVFYVVLEEPFVSA